MSKKLIVTNMTALKSKYGRGMTRIHTALKSLKAADKKRGVTTTVVALDDATGMKKFKAKAVNESSKCKDYKTAIDRVYKALQPDYLVLLGAIDVIPHQDLRNPVFSPDDPDRYAWSDLPYACDAPYSRRIQDFTGPTRVVGRIPDLTGGSDPRYLVGVLNTATRWKPRPPENYDGYLGISASEWKNSTKLSLKKLFGSSSDIKLSPPGDQNWKVAAYRKRSHFVNCHGAPSDPKYYGQKGDNYPIALSAERLDGKLLAGTVATAECCYGAELYDPADAGGRAGICSTYLGSEAYGFFGSSTIAYGPASGNGAADFICQDFLKHVFEGASLGRAALQSRHDFVQRSDTLDPVDQKTLAQFSLLGDPSIHAVESAAPAIVVSKNRAKGLSAEKMLLGRADRRFRLLTTGLTLANLVRVAVKSAKLKRTASVKRSLHELARKMKASAEDVLSFSIRKPPRSFLGKALAVGLAQATAYHVMTRDMTTKKSPTKRLEILVAKEENGKIVSYERYHSR